MEKLVGAILGTEVKRFEGTTEAEIIESSGQYNKDETISVEKLEDGLFYVMIIKNRDWEFEGYYEEV